MEGCLDWQTLLRCCLLLLAWILLDALSVDSLSLYCSAQTTLYSSLRLLAQAARFDLAQTVAAARCSPAAS
jgi:hypothetical protein